MNLLLDTHIWLWSIGETRRLSTRVASALGSSENQLWLSPISVWEALLLARKGRVSMGDDPQAWVDRAFNTAPIQEAPLTRAIVLESDKIQMPHRDPADRFITATASILGFTLVTSDKAILKARVVPTLANR